jgi:5-methylcytosine-specific restriction endonuclease McrA
MARQGLCGGCWQHFSVEVLKRGRCPSCLRRQQRQKDQRRGSSSQRGYGGEWRKLREQVIAAHPYCSICGHTGTKDNPLSLDHILPRSQGGTDALSNLRVLCLHHNQQRSRGRATHQLVDSQRTVPSHDDSPSDA